MRVKRDGVAIERRPPRKWRLAAVWMESFLSYSDTLIEVMRGNEAGRGGSHQGEREAKTQKNED